MRPIAALLSVLGLLVGAAPGAAAPDGQITWAVHTTLVPAYFDPAETIIVTPFMVLYALHDALVKPMPGKGMAPSLAESWSASPDGLVYEFALRKGVRFHNGDPVTSDDVKFSFERYKGIWHDRRVRLAANLAIDRQAINEARTAGMSRITSSIVPSTFELYWAPPSPSYDAVAARRLLAEAGYPGGFDAGDYFCDMTSADAAEAVIGYLQAVGIRAKLRPLERAAFNKGLADKKLKNLVQVIGGGFGNAATRLEAYVYGGGTYAYGSYPDVDGLFREQAGELDRAKREALLHRIQQLVHERAMFAPIYELAFITAVGRRVEEPGLGLIAGYAFSGPYEDVRLRAK